MSAARIYWVDDEGPHDQRLDGGLQAKALSIARVIHDNHSPIFISLWEIRMTRSGEELPPKWDWGAS